jgi:hypothetical protein
MMLDNYNKIFIYLLIGILILLFFSKQDNLQEKFAGKDIFIEEENEQNIDFTIGHLKKLINDVVSLNYYVDAI